MQQPVPPMPQPAQTMPKVTGGYGGTVSSRAVFKNYLEQRSASMMPIQAMPPSPAPVQMMGGGIVPLFGGLGRY